jgi:hypothetical protein
MTHAGVHLMNTINIIWAIPILFSLHELEEWNILDWYEKHYVNLPGSTKFSIHLHIFFFCVVGFLLTYIAYQFHQTCLFSIIISFFSAFILFNVFQHIVWTIQLRTYSPGLVTGLIMLVVIGIVNYILIKNDLIHIPYYALILLYIFPAINTVKIKREMTPEIRKVHLFFIKIERLLKKIR